MKNTNYKMEDYIAPPDYVETFKEGDKIKHKASYNDTRIDVWKLIHFTKDVPVELASITEFENGLNEKCWSVGIDKIAPSEVIKKYTAAGNIDNLITHYPELEQDAFRIAHADYKQHPLLVYKGIVIDGKHRLAKAIIDGVTEINIKRLIEIPIEAIVKIS